MSPVIITFLTFNSICFCLIKYRKLIRVFDDQRYSVLLGAHYMQAIRTGFLIESLVIRESLKVDSMQ